LDDKSTVIYLVRHGMVHNPEEILYGRMPGYRLSDEGREQAAAAGRALSEAPLAALYASPQQRAQETAGIIRDIMGNGLAVNTDDRLNEVHTPYDGHALTVLAANNFDLYTGTEPPYEQPSHILERVRAFMLSMRTAHTGQHVAAVTHGDIVVFSYLFAHGVPADPKRKIDMASMGLGEPYPATASLTKFTFHTSDPDEVPAVAYRRPY
jgi:broad specificity phosphatase PhoE